MQSLQANIEKTFNEYVANLVRQSQGLPYDDGFMKKIETISGAVYDTSLFREHVRNVLCLNYTTPVIDIDRVPILRRAIRDYVAIHLPSKPTDKYRSLDAQWEGS